MKKLVVNCETGEAVEVDLTEEEIAELRPADEAAWTYLREERTRRLMASDWTQVADAPVDASAWSTYRQELRDLPANTTDPTAPDWPTPPS